MIYLDIKVFIRLGFLSNIIIQQYIDIEICVVEVCQDKRALIIVSIYRLHSGTIEKLIYELNNVLKNSVVQGLQCIITGNFDVDLCSDTNEVQKFWINMQSYSLMPIITKLTRFSTNYRNPNHLFIYKSGIILHDITSHCPTFY